MRNIVICNKIQHSSDLDTKNWNTNEAQMQFSQDFFLFSRHLYFCFFSPASDSFKCFLIRMDPSDVSDLRAVILCKKRSLVRLSAVFSLSSWCEPTSFLAFSFLSWKTRSSSFVQRVKRPSCSSHKDTSRPAERWRPSLRSKGLSTIMLLQVSDFIVACRWFLVWERVQFSREAAWERGFVSTLTLSSNPPSESSRDFIVPPTSQPNKTDVSYKGLFLANTLRINL